MDLSWHALNSMVQVKHIVTLKSKDLATCAILQWLEKVNRGELFPANVLLVSSR